MKTPLLVVGLATSILVGCDQRPLTEAEKKANEQAARERIQHQNDGKEERDKTKRVSENKKWFSRNHDKISVVVTNMQLGTRIVPELGADSDPVPTVKFAGFLANN